MKKDVSFIVLNYNFAPINLLNYYAFTLYVVLYDFCYKFNYKNRQKKEKASYLNAFVLKYESFPRNKTLENTSCHSFGATYLRVPIHTYCSCTRKITNSDNHVTNLADNQIL